MTIATTHHDLIISPRYNCIMQLSQKLLATALIFFAACAARAQFAVSDTFKIGGTGGWDYLTVDPDAKLLYVPRSTHTLVLDYAGKTIADIPGQKRNHGVAIVHSVNRGFITDGDDASVTIFDLKSNEVLGKIKADKDADGVIYDSASNKVLVVCGDAGVLIPISPDVDPKNGKADPPIDLGGKPEFLAADGQGKVFINLEDKDEVAVVDTKSMKVLDHHSVAPGGSPVGMSMDIEHRRLFIGCRKPQKLVVMNADDGKVVADLPIGAGVDATKFDNGYALASCRDGTLTVVHEDSPDSFTVAQTLTTPIGARTMGLDPAAHTLYLPTAEFKPSTGNARAAAKPDTFMIVVVKPVVK
jgi:DNA-binding beta-propeller fold protein YncE